MKLKFILRLGLQSLARVAKKPLNLFVGVVTLCLTATAFAEYRGVQLKVENCPTASVAQATSDYRGITGKPVALSVSLKTNNVAVTTGHTVTVSVATIPLTGSCLYDAKTILGSSTIASGLTSNSLGTLYLYSDTLRLSCTNANTTNIDVNVFLILDKP